MRNEHAISEATQITWRKQFAVWVNLRVAIHARLSRWNRSFRSDLDRVVAIATINAKFARMHRVTKRNWLHWLVPNISRVGTEPEGDHECDIERRGHASNHSRWQKQVGPPRKYEVISTHRYTDPGGL